MKEIRYNGESKVEGWKKGWGDRVADFTKATGVEKVVKTVTNAMGIEDCGCEKRLLTLLFQNLSRMLNTYHFYGGYHKVREKEDNFYRLFLYHLSLQCYLN